MAGFFITIEGIEGAGKTTIAKRLDAWLQSNGYKTFCTREPGGTEIGETLRELILNAERPLTVQAELLLIEAARAQIMDEVILPRLEEGITVILDRHCDSTTAYQGYGRGVNINLISQCNSFACQGRTPDLTILLDVDVKTGLMRAMKVRERAGFQDRFETEDIDFMELVRKGFLEIARREPSRVTVVSSQEDIDVVWETVIADISNCLIPKS
ncbi:MAG: dTMP kinase [Candidatus Omnitrophica bacterium]|nr:dTMP kinase [Candidatus Omnitrophota bacterium]